MREAALHLVKRSQELRDNADVLMRQAEVALVEAQRALRAAMSPISAVYQPAGVATMPAGVIMTSAQEPARRVEATMPPQPKRSRRE